MGTRTAVSEIKLQLSSTIKNTLTDSQSATAQVGQQILSGKLLTGVSGDQANRAWEDRTRTISSGSTEDIDLYDLAGEDIGAGDGKDALGQAWVAEEIVTLIIHQTAGTGRLEIMPSNPTNHWQPCPSMTVSNGGALRSGALMMIHNQNTAGFDVTDASSHVIRLGANGGDVTYDIYVLARHDDDESSSSTTSSLSSSSSTTSSSSSSSTSSQSTSSSSISSSSSSSTSTLSSSSTST